MDGRDTFDPKALIWEAYRIEGITAPECRSIFLDWALSLPEEITPQAGILLAQARHADAPADHPMSLVLADGLKAATAKGRRGGRAARISGQNT